MPNPLLDTEFDITLEKLRKYCAYQERCHQEVKYKAIALGLRGEAVDKAMSVLIEENFLNEQRFARALVGGKMRIKRWGKQKICQMLVQKGIGDYIIRHAFEQYTDDIEKQNLAYWCEKKVGDAGNLPFKEKTALVNYLFQKGFDRQMVFSYLNYGDE